LHRGHVEYLQQARALGDCLAVGLNDDRSVRALKGPGRPLMPQADRAALLAALSCVDYVCTFSGASVEPLVADLLPDILVKGGDSTQRTRSSSIASSKPKEARCERSRCGGVRSAANGCTLK